MPLTRIESGLLANTSVTGDKIGPTAINANNIVNATITGNKIATGQITGNLLTANCVTAGNNITGTLAAGNGGTGLSSPGATGNVLTSNGTTWVSSKASGGSGAGGSTLSGSQTLTSSSDGAININFTAAGQSITLPNATTLSEAAILYHINNTSAFIGTLYDAAGSILGFIPAGSSILIGLVDNTTSAGTWSVNGHETLGVTSELGSSLFASTFQVIDLGSSRFLLYLTTGSMVVYNSSTNTIGSAYTPPISSYDITVLDTDKLIIMYPDSTGSTTAYNARVLTISGTTITAQTVTTTNYSFTNSSSPNDFQIVALSSSLAIMHFCTSSSAANLLAVSISGNSCTFGSPVSYGLTATGNANDIARFSATQFIAYSSRSSSSFGGLIGGSVSGTNITLDGNGRYDNLGVAAQTVDNQITVGEAGVGKKQIFRTLGNGRVIFATRAASGQGTYADLYCCSVSGSTLFYDTLRVDSSEQMSAFAIYPLTSNTFFFTWKGFSNTSYRLTHITNSTGNTLTRGAGNEITVVPSTSSGTPIYFRATPDGGYMITASYGTSPTYSVAKFTLDGVTPLLTSRRDITSRLGSSNSLTTALLGVVSSATKSHLVAVNGNIESNLNFTSFRENLVVNNSVVDQAARIILVGTKSIYVSATGSLKVLEASK